MGLRWIGLRSTAELDTFLTRLRELPGISSFKYRGLAVPDSLLSELGPLFCKDWTFFDEVVIADGQLLIRLSRESQHPVVRFTAQLTITSADKRLMSMKKEGVVTTSAGIWSILLPPQCIKQPFIVDVALDGRLAYRNSFPALSKVVS